MECTGEKSLVASNQMPPLGEALELFEEAEVVFDEEADVVDAVLAHGDAFDAEAEGPAGVNFRIDFAVGEDVGVDHAAAAEFDPALLVFEPDVDFSGGFGEGEEAG